LNKEVHDSKSLKIKIVRSVKRMKTVQARHRGDVLEILAPAHLSDAELKPHIENLRRRIEQRQEALKLNDEDLQMRAMEINQMYFQGKLEWESIRWVTNQEKRHGSCHPRRKTIRISHRIATMPQFVRDYVLIHELAHLLEPNHSRRFWKLVNEYPKAERAKGYLMAVGLEEVECAEGEAEVGEHKLE